MSILEKLEELKLNSDYSREKLDKLADEMEEATSSAELWNSLRLGFETGEYMENLIYLAHELDL